MASDPDDSGSPETHPNKRVKTLASGSPESSPDKGKAKLEISDWESEWNCCGICLSESGRGTTIIRGCIDCCEHFFCFVCIMEWSKVESKCPMCKRRFSSIRRPPNPHVFPSERVVNIPVRDQVYHYHGNVTTGPPDPYAEALCSVCHSTADDSLLLLCDLCDTGYHTYCVGLGATVPEGDWFCTDCSLLRAEQAQSETKTDCYTQSSFSTRVSIYEIVRESPTDSLGTSGNSSCNDTRRQNTPQSSSIGLGSVEQNGVAGNGTKFNARTLGHCRNVHGRIRTLREQWNCFRSGSLTFSSTKMGNTSSQPPSVSRASQPVASQSCNRNTLDSKRLIEVQKAWKMMDMAKAIERNRDQNKSSSRTLKNTVERNTSCKEAGESSSRSILLEQHRPTSSQNVGPGIHIQSHARKSGNVKLQGASDVDRGFLTACGSSSSEVASSRKSQTSVQSNICRGKYRLSQKKNLCAGSTHLISSIRSASTATIVVCDKEICSSSNSTANTPREKLKAEKSGIKSRTEMECEAKAEIQTLVKLNLKILCRDKKLEVGIFKQVARQATHSILAACGLEHPRPGIASLPECVCVHAKEGREVRRCNLMPNSCRECFFLFVKNVVNNILLGNS